MESLENKIKTSFFGKVKDNFGGIRSFTISKIAVYSLAGILGGGVGYGCESSEGTRKNEDIMYTTDLHQPKEVEERKEEPLPICWDKTYENGFTDEANSVQQTTDGGYVVAGWTSSIGDRENYAMVLKFNSAGELEWDKAIEGDSATSIQQTSDGSYIVASRNESGAWIFKLDSNGNLVWDKKLGEYGERASSIQQTNDLGYIVAGYTYSKGAGKKDAWILKLYSNGAVEWDKVFGDEGNDGINSIQQTSDGGYIAGGYKTGEVYESAWVLKLNLIGDLELDKALGGNGYNQATSVQQTVDGGYVVSDLDATVSKLDKDGNLEWSKTFGESSWASAYSIQQTADLGYVLAGRKGEVNSENSDAWVLKLDKDGNSEWDKTFGKCGQDMANSIEQTKDGGYIVAGLIRLSGGCEGHQDAWVFKLDKNGNMECK